MPGQLGACNSEHRRVTLSSSTSSAASLMETSRNGGTNNSTVQKLFQVATRGIRNHHATAAQYPTLDGSFHALANARGYLHATPVAIDAAYGTTAPSAAVLARSNGVVQAGFLQKLGENIPEFKRRFFVLKPETSLYYYLSPNETEPRGKIDLEGSAIDQMEKTPDGRLRFIVSLKRDDDCGIEEKNRGDYNNNYDDNDDDNDNNNNNHDSNDTTKSSYQQQKQQKIVLEARSVEIGEEWIRHMKGERVSFLKEKNESLTSTITKQANEIADLEQQIQHFRMIETDRDGALEDAQNWKNKFSRLDEAMRLLTQQIRKSVTTPFAKEDRKNYEGDDDSGEYVVENEGLKGKNENENEIYDFSDNDKENPAGKQSSSKEDACHEVPGINTHKSSIKKSSGLALLDDLAHEDMDVEEIMDVPGTYFSGLSNACKQQKESSKLALIEASAAVDDVLQANERVEVIQKRMHKAEKQILKLWEENCDIRKTLKQKKREKRVLVKEVKQLQQTVQDLKVNIKKSSTVVLGPNKPLAEDGPMADTMIGSDEERLIIELEEHVASSIRLHERLLAGTDFDREMEQSISTDQTSVNFETMDMSLNGAHSRFEHGGLETGKAKLLSLFDDETDSDDSSVRQQDSIDNNSRIETRSLMGSIASSADYIAIKHIPSVMSVGKPPSLSFVDTDVRSPERVNPLLELDDEKHEEESKRNFCKPSSPKLITENGKATSRLVCPLADVVDVRGRFAIGNDVGSADDEGNSDLRVHHLTFYSQKIGLQFQKASPAPLKSRGLLTDAVTADLVEEVGGSDKTAAELRSIASIASLAKGGINRQRRESKCPLSVPEDIVLVCGFEGFDDSGVNQRPKSGARLVAFDGVSVEVGKWTFESIKKAIKSRGRPLTLSFRNDFLTTKQRATLTKAVKDIDAKRDPEHPVMKYERPKSTIQSLPSTSSFESGHFLNNNNNHLQGVHRHGGTPAAKILDISTAATEESNCWNRCPASSSSSISSDFRDNHVGRLLAQPPSSSSVSTHKSRNSVTSIANNSLYSLSEVGSAGAVSSLMNILVKKKASSSPVLQQGGQQLLGDTKNAEEGLEQSRRFGIGINPSGTQQHQDFKANLL
jgi:hypothetical protein